MRWELQNKQNKCTTQLFAFLLPGKNSFPFRKKKKKKSPLFASQSQLPAAALKQYSNGIPRSAPTPTTLGDGTYNEHIAPPF